MLQVEICCIRLARSGLKYVETNLKLKVLNELIAHCEVMLNAKSSEEREK